MKAFYINLDRATERRANIEKSFSAYAGPNWQLARFKAIEAAECADVPGSIRPAEKACFLSHAAVIANQRGTSEDFLVLEDDTCFGPGTFRTLDRILAMAKGDEWDILFTDVIAQDTFTINTLLELRKALQPTGSVITLNLTTFPFFGANSYLVNHRAVEKLGALLQPLCCQVAYDIALMHLVNAGTLTAHVTFPFLTAVSRGANTTTSIQDPEEIVNLIYDAFRRMVWIHGTAKDRSDFEAAWASQEGKHQIRG